MMFEDDSTLVERAIADPAAIFDVLRRHEVDYVVIGELAAIAHGEARNTNIIEFTAATSRTNLVNLVDSLHELGATLDSGSNSQIGSTAYSAEALISAVQLRFRTRTGGLDFFNEVPGGLPFEDLRRNAIKVNVAGTAIRVAGLEDLLRMKHAAGRDQDLRDIAALTEIEGT